MWSRVKGLAFKVQDSELQVQRLGFRALGSGLRVKGSGFGV